MSGGKSGGTQQVNTGPYSIAEPAYAPLPAHLGDGGKTTTFQNLPSQLDLIAEQLHAGYPAMSQKGMLEQLQKIYTPVNVYGGGGPQAATAAAVKKAEAAPAPAAKPAASGYVPGSIYNARPHGYGQGEMFQSFSEFLDFLNMQGGNRNVSR